MTSKSGALPYELREWTPEPVLRECPLRVDVPRPWAGPAGRGLPGMQAGRLPGPSRERHRARRRRGAAPVADRVRTRRTASWSDIGLDAPPDLARDAAEFPRNSW